MTGELTFEIGTEEIPALFLKKANADLLSLLTKEFEINSLEFDKIETFSTPRRLVAHVTGLPDSQQDRVIENFGPPKRIAFDESGKPSKAALGFAKSQNINFNDVEIVSRDNGEFLCVRKELKGEKTSTLLKDILPKVINSLHFNKSMRWGDLDTSFVRPIRWLGAVFNGKTVPYSFENINSSDVTYGHRFTSKKPLKFKDWKTFAGNLEKNNVVLDPAKRKEIIEKEIRSIAKKTGGKIEEDAGLIETVINIVEHPTVLIGQFEEKFLKLPKEVLISVMKNHQKYFPVYNSKGGLMPYFIFVCGTPVKDGSVVAKGNERVIRARFNDAEFFYSEDSGKKLSDHLDDLKNMVYLSQIGTYFEKVKRMEEISKSLVAELSLEKEKTDLVKAASLSKCDLATQMVFEFPELQGTMGNYYAITSGENKSVANAIEEHYMPLTRDGELPGTVTGSLLSLTEKLDNITSCFIAGLIPTGSADPYALRRQAIGIIRIVIKNKFNLNLAMIVERSVGITVKSLDKEKKKNIDVSNNETGSSIISFIADRFKNFLIEEGYTNTVIDSVISTGFNNIIEAYNKIKAVEKFSKQKEFEELAVTFKRVVNIAKEKPAAKMNTKLFNDSSEKNLYKTFSEIKKKTETFLKPGNITKDSDYIKALNLIKTLKKPVDDFFDSVMVMDKDEKIKNNRLALLSEIKELFFHISDFSKI